jgi:capsule polysaccharide export protein KpsC/LpsZ
MAQDNQNYEDIIYLPHPDSPKHPRMSRQDRAAQFSPFAAITEHKAAIAEVACSTSVDDRS